MVEAAGFPRIRGLKYVSCPDQYGYGTAALAYIHGFLHSGIPVTWTPVIAGKPWAGRHLPVGRLFRDYQALQPVCNRAIDYNAVIIHAVPEQYPDWIRREKGKFLIGYSVWETDRLPGHWPFILNRMGLIMVPTQWNRDVYRRSGVSVPIEVIPHIHAPLPEADPSPPWDIDENERVFYTVGDWTNRKAVWKTIRCYLGAFSAADPTVLVVKTSRYDLTRNSHWRRFFNTSSRLKKLLRRHACPARVLLLNSRLDRSQIAALHARGECFVSLAHSEGWGLAAFEAAGAGNPVIITDYGGPREYLPADLAFMVKSSEIPVHDPAGSPSYGRDQLWGDPDLEEAKNHLRYVFHQRDISRRKGEQLAAYVRGSFSEEAVMGRMKKILRLN
jgi:glycosyltransferase involved in cell wall biosynthesis